MPEFIEVTTDELLDALLSYAPVRPVHIEGPPGSGKTECAKLFFENIGMPFEEFDGGTTAIEDIVGLPIPDHVNQVIRYYPPVRLKRDKPFGIILDDMPNAKLDVLRAFYKIMQFKKTDSFEMPEGSIVISTGNRTEDNAYVEALPAPLVNRMMILRLADDVDGWLRHARERNFHPLIIDFIESRPKNIRSPSNPHGRPFTSKRSLHMLSDALWQHKELNPHRVQIAAEASIGLAHAVEFQGFYRTKADRLTVERLLKGDIRWPGSPADRQELFFLMNSFRFYLIKHLPATVDAVNGSTRELAHKAKALLAALAEISGEMAQHVIIQIDGEAVPDWFVVEVARDLPRIAASRK